MTLHAGIDVLMEAFCRFLALSKAFEPRLLLYQPDKRLSPLFFARAGDCGRLLSPLSEPGKGKGKAQDR